MAEQRYIEISKSYFLDAYFEQAFIKTGLTSIEKVFSFSTAKNLNKQNLAAFRSRLQFDVDSPHTTTLFLKRYDNPPIMTQLKNWICARGRKSCGLLESETAANLKAAGINTPKTIAYGEQSGYLFEKRSFIISEKIHAAEALERKLPDCFNAKATKENLKLRRIFIEDLAEFISKFHCTKYRHLDLYLSHIFYSDSGEFYLIDLARAFSPMLLKRRFQIKDIAQLYYSAPGRFFSQSDRLRFFLRYAGKRKLSAADKIFIRQVIKKAKRMAKHGKKHGRNAPFENSQERL